MQVSFDCVSLISAVGIFSCFFFSSILLAQTRGNKRANTILSVLLLVVLCSIINPGLLLYTNLIYRVPHLLNTPYFFILLMGPLFYFYVRVLTQRDYRFKLCDVLHLLPELGWFALRHRFYLMSGTEKMQYFINWNQNEIPMHQRIFEHFAGFLVVIHMLLYVYASRRLIRNYTVSIKKYFSDIDKLNLSWLNFFIVMILLAFIPIGLVVIVEAVFSIPVTLILRFIPVTVSLCMCTLSYKALLQADLFTTNNQLSTVTKENDGDDQKSRTTSAEKKITLKNMQEYKNRLETIMQKEAPYKDPSLTLYDLAKAVNIPRNYLSNIINSYYGINYYDYINGFRVNEAKRLIEQSAEINMLKIAYDSGFNSKSTFNKMFKQLTGLTPTQYKCDKTAVSA